MRIQKAIKFRIYPNSKQKKWINNCFRTSKFIYNYFLAEQKETSNWLQSCGIGDRADRNKLMRDNHLYFYKRGKKVDGNVVVQAPYDVLSQLSKQEFYSFLKDFPSTSRNYVLTNLDEAFKKVYKEGAGYPKFKKPSDSGSFTIQKMNRNLFNIDIKSNKIGILNISTPSKVKDIVKDIEINLGKGNDHFLNNYKDLSKYKINSYTISNNSKGDYFISIQIEQEVGNISKKNLKDCVVLGIDMGVVRPVTTSEEKDFDNSLLSKKIDFLKKLQKAKAQIERVLARKRLENKDWKTSKKYAREKKKLSSIYTKITNQRRDIQHNISNYLATDDSFDIIAEEKLNIKGMTKRSAKGKSNAKKGLSKRLLDVGIHEIQRQIEYKSEWSSKRVIKVDPKHTSTTCSCCGYSDKRNRVRQNLFTCVKCGHSENADLNAAKNIKAKALKLIEEKGEKAFV
jgi:putative transposase